MESEFQKIIVDSSFSKASYMSGHVHEISRPCRVHALYCERTGTLLFECMWCDGEWYSRKEIDANEVRKFEEELVLYVIEAYS